MLKYKVIRKIVCDKEDLIIDSDYRGNSRYYLKELYDKQGFLGYKIIAGLYIFYITEEVYNEGIREKNISSWKPARE